MEIKRSEKERKEEVGLRKKMGSENERRESGCSGIFGDR